MSTEEKTDTRFDDIVSLMQRTKLSVIPWRTAKHKLVTLSLDDTICEALTILTDENILSAPVFDKVGAFRGFTDMQQLTRYVVRLCGGPPERSTYAKLLAMDSTTIRDIIFARAGTGGPIYGEYRWPINETASLYHAFERMARAGQHRLAIQSYTGRVVGVITQSQIIDYLRAHKNRLGDAKKVMVSNIRPYNVVAKINENRTAVSAFQIMDSKIRSLNGVAVVDNSGALTDVISTNDLRGILPGSDDFNMVWKSIREFKSHIRLKFPGVKYLPVAVNRTDTLEDVITRMADNKVHRVFVVDSNGAPVDVISQTDVLRYVLGAVSPTASW